MDSQNIVIVKCPHCGLQLSFKAVPNYREKPISCPRCHHSGIVKDFTIVKVPGQTPQSKPAPTPDPTLPLGSTPTSEPTAMLNPYAPTQDFGKAYIRCIDTNEKHRLNPGPTTVGRRAKVPKANVTFEDKDMYMSRLHATITIVGDGNNRQFHLRDEKSANGTMIDGQRLPSGSIVKLTPGKQFQMGKLTFVCGFDDERTRIVGGQPGDTGATTMV